MVLTAILVLVLLWLLGFSFHIAGGFIHILLIAALVIWIFDRLSHRTHTDL